MNSGVTLYGFEDGTQQGLKNRGCLSLNQTCNTVVTDPVRAGSYALQFSLSGTEDDRTEIAVNDEILLDVDYWIGFSNYLLTWDDTNLNSVVYQSHRGHNQPGSSPMVGLRATGREWRLTQELDSPGPVDEGETLWTGPVDEGVWVDWVLHVKYTLDDDGIIELFKNGQLVYSKPGRTVAIGTTVGPYDRVGIYHGLDESGTRELVYDEIRYINSNSARFDDVNVG